MSDESQRSDPGQPIVVPPGYVVVPAYMFNEMCRVFYGRLSANESIVEPTSPVIETETIDRGNVAFEPDDVMLEKMRALSRGTTANWLDQSKNAVPRGHRARKLGIDAKESADAG